MKKVLLIIFVSLLTLCVFAACTKRPASSPVPQSPTSSQPTQSTDDMLEELVQTDDLHRPSLAEASRNNANIDVSGIRLIQFDQPKSGDKIAVMTTSMGDIHIRLFPDHAPKAVENFITLAEDGFYNNKAFHHVAPGYLIQNGAVNFNGTGSLSIFTDENGTPTPYEDEFSMDLWHFRGAVSCANPGAKDSNGSQFFIVQAPEITGYTVDKLREAQFPPGVVEKYAETGGAPHMDWNHTIFGMIIEGIEVVDEISNVEADGGGVPKTPVLIQKLEIIVVE